MAKASIAVGLNKGYTVTRRSTRPRPSRRKGVRSSCPEQLSCAAVRQLELLLTNWPLSHLLLSFLSLSLFPPQLQGKRRAIAREVAREVAGFAPYEKRMMELLRNNLDKRAMRLCKRKVRSPLCPPQRCCLRRFRLQRPVI